MSARDIAVKAAVGVALLVVISLVTYGLSGLGTPRAESEYTGTVVDVVEDKGVLLRPSWVNMKTNPRSSDVQQYCIHPSDEDRLTDKLYAAMESGDRVTVTYSRPLWVAPQHCEDNQAVLHDVTAVNGTL